MEIDQNAQAGSLAVGNAGYGLAALVLERVGPVRERAQQLLEADGARVCATSDPQLFRELRDRVHFDWIVVGESGVELEDLKLSQEGAEIVLLVHEHDTASVRRRRLVVPSATLVDRSLATPDALRVFAGANAATDRDVLDASRGESDPVRETFGAFGLSERQLEVLRAALLGERPAEIGQQLFISELTVRNHLHTIYEKIGVSGRRELGGRFVAALLAETVRPGPEASG